MFGVKILDKGTIQEENSVDVKGPTGLPNIDDLQEEKINDILRSFSNNNQEQKPLSEADAQACMYF